MPEQWPLRQSDMIERIFCASLADQQNKDVAEPDKLRACSSLHLQARSALFNNNDEAKRLKVD